jgi:adenosylmethionine-8-amino-7-oxononanoate aminotransferase
MTVGMRDGDQSEHFKYVPDLVHHLSAPYPYRRPEGMSLTAFSDFLVAEFEAKIAELGPENIACFIAEPAQASGGVCIPPPNYLPRMRELCTRHGILFIADEIVTAFGRLGHFFASYDEYGIVPDMILCAKGITSGYIPLSAVIYSDGVHNVISAPDPDAWFTHGYTYSGHPVGASLGLVNIDIMERDGLIAQAAEVGPYFLSVLRERIAGHPFVGDVRGMGQMIAAEFVADKASKRFFDPKAGAHRLVAAKAFEHGVLSRALPYIEVTSFSPPLSMTRAEADEAAERYAKALADSTDDLAKLAKA